MSMKAVLFDLDATLLPMDQDFFIKSYFKSLSAKMAQFGYDPNMLMKAMMLGINAMVTNDGKKTNEDAFWDAFKTVYGEKTLQDVNLHKEYYENDFDALKSVCGYSEKSNQIVKHLKSKGIRVILATNPVFPSIATYKRIEWAGMDKNDFELITTYENSSYCKPNPQYYSEILQKIGLTPEECVMVGNDVSDDMVASTLGMKVFLLTDCLINTQNADITSYPQGSFDDLKAYLKKTI